MRTCGLVGYCKQVIAEGPVFHRHEGDRVENSRRKTITNPYHGLAMDQTLTLLSTGFLALYFTLSTTHP